MKLIKKLYDWVMSWSTSPYGAFFLFGLAFVESFIFPIPPDVLLIALCLGMRKKSISYAALASIGSLIGAIIGYYIGHTLWWSGDNSFSPLAQWFFNHIPGFHEDIFREVQLKYEIYNVWIVFIAAFTPIPFKIITISAGAFNINFMLFILGSLVGRSARFFLVGFLILKFGEKIKVFIDKYFNLLSILFVILLIAGFIILEFIFS